MRETCSLVWSVLALLVLAPGQYQVGEFVEDKDQERQIGLSCFDAFKVRESNL
jgi:hypothetical protein